jgi:hypothetical protein
VATRLESIADVHYDQMISLYGPIVFATEVNRVLSSLACCASMNRCALVTVSLIGLFAWIILGIGLEKAMESLIDWLFSR